MWDDIWCIQHIVSNLTSKNLCGFKLLKTRQIGHWSYKLEVEFFLYSSLLNTCDFFFNNNNKLSVLCLWGLAFSLKEKWPFFFLRKWYSRERKEKVYVVVKIWYFMNLKEKMMLLIWHQLLFLTWRSKM